MKQSPIMSQKDIDSRMTGMMNLMRARQPKPAMQVMHARIEDDNELQPVIEEVEQTEEMIREHD